MKFKAGDEIIMLEDCCKNKKGKKYILKMYDDVLFADTGTFHDSCSCVNLWKLVKKNKKPPKMESKTNADTMDVVMELQRIVNMLADKVLDMTNRMDAMAVAIAKFGKGENAQRKQKTDNEIGIAVAKYFVHRYTKHNPCGANKALTQEEFEILEKELKRVEEEIKEME